MLCLVYFSALITFRMYLPSVVLVNAALPVGTALVVVVDLPDSTSDIPVEEDAAAAVLVDTWVGVVVCPAFACVDWILVVEAPN